MTNQIAVPYSRTRHHFIFQLGLALTTIGLMLLAILAKHYPYFSFDLLVTHALQSIHSAQFMQSMQLISFLGNPIAAICLIGCGTIAFLTRKRTLEAMTLLLSSIGIELIGIGLKIVIHRPRPSSLLIHQYIQLATQFDSFPSGHVLFFMGFFGFLFFLVFTTLRHSAIRTIALLFIAALIVAVGVSRIYLGAHWFSDVIGAYILGALGLFVVAHVYHLLRLTRQNQGSSQ